MLATPAPLSLRLHRRKFLELHLPECEILKADQSEAIDLDHASAVSRDVPGAVPKSLSTGIGERSTCRIPSIQVSISRFQYGDIITW